MLNKRFIKRKITLIGEELERLKEFSDFTLEELAKDYIKQAAVERLLEKIINRAIDVNQHLIAELSEKTTPKSYKETFLELSEINVYPRDFAEQISKSAGTRNVLTHDYNNIDYSKIYNSIFDCLKDYHQYCQYILDFLDKQK